jgi:Dyp-type peroxidase family
VIDLGDVQSNVLRGYRFHETLPSVEYVYFQFLDRDKAREFVRAAHALTTSCIDFDRLATEGEKTRFVWNLGFSYDGLRFLDPRVGQPPKQGDDPDDFGVFRGFAAFALGAREPERAESIGDVNESAPKNWLPVYREDGLHAVLSLSAWSRDGIDAALGRLDDLLASHRGAVKRIGSETGQALGGKEHFGYMDGIGQPFVEGSGLLPHPGEGTPVKGGWEPIPSGEFVLGYPNARDARPACDLPDPFAPNDPLPQLLMNGSFLVIRRLREDVAAFRDWVCAQANRAAMSEELFAAKLVGRWKSGAPLALAPDYDEPEIVDDPNRVNDFRYSKDASGYDTPFGCHIRRANPRDDPTGPTTIQTAGRRIIRRATPYGPELPEGSPDDGQDRGVLFAVINSNIEEQFEFVQANWLNNTLSSRRLTYEDDKDPLLGANESGKGKFTIPDREGPIFVWNLPRFVSVTGSAYFFLPGLRALEDLLDGKL